MFQTLKKAKKLQTIHLFDNLKPTALQGKVITNFRSFNKSPPPQKKKSCAHRLLQRLSYFRGTYILGCIFHNSILIQTKFGRHHT